MQIDSNYTTFYIVRHGETDWNARGIIQGHVNTPLNEKGENQAASLANQLRDVHFDHIFSSDLDRAMRTAEFLRLERDLAIETTQLLREKKFGEIEGKPMSELDKLDAIIASLSEKEKFTYKQESTGESDEDIISRLITFLREVAVQASGKTILIVTHGGIIRTLLIHLGFFTYETSRLHRITNTAYIKLTSDGIDFFIHETNGIKKKD